MIGLKIIEKGCANQKVRSVVVTEDLGEDELAVLLCLTLGYIKEA